MHLQVWVLTLCALYGSVFSIGKLCLEYCPPLFLTGTRMILAGVLLLAYEHLIQRRPWALRRPHVIPVFVIALTGVYLTNAFEFWGLQYMSAGKTCFIYSFSPIATAILSYFWFSEKISLQKGVGLLVGILGFIPLLLDTPTIEDLSGRIGPLSFAELALLLAAIATSIGWISMRSLVKQKDLTATSLNGVTMLVGGVLALAHSRVTENWAPTPVDDWVGFLPYFLFLTLISNIISYNLHAVLLRSFTATYISFAGLSQPFFAALFGFLFLDEVLAAPFWISVCAVSLGLFLYYREELR